MKIARFKVKDKTSYGVVIGDGIIDVGAKMGGTYADVADVLRADALNRVAEFAGGRIPDISFDQVEFLPPVRSRLPSGAITAAPTRTWARSFRDTQASS
jgi:hypothetical protein